MPSFRKISQIREIDDEDDIKEIIVEHKSGFNVIEMLVIVIISIAFGVMVGSSISFFRQEYQGEKVSVELQQLIAVYRDVLNNYYKTLDEADLADAAIDGMLSSLDDPYSLYMDEDDAVAFNETVDGSYVGIGVTIGMSDTGDFIVLAVTQDSSAKQAGINVGDVIVEIDSQSVIGLSLDDISSIIKGKENTKLKLTLLRGENKLYKVVERKTIDLVSVVSKIYARNNGNIGYISISTFAANTYKQFKKELKSLEKNNIYSLIIDVRSNPGGHLNQARDILELFMKKDKILYQISFQDNIKKIKDSTKSFRSYPIVILINSDSASASEILASSFRDSYADSFLIGNTTYGKGTIQQVYSLIDGSSLKYTTEKWLTPKGNWIDGKGIHPDKEIVLDDAFIQNFMGENDTQLQSALEYLENKKGY